MVDQQIVQQAAYLNSQAISLLMLRAPEQAIQTFKASLRVLNATPAVSANQFYEQGRSGSDYYNKQTNPTGENNSQKPATPQIPSTLQIYWVDIPYHVNIKAENFIYSRTIAFNPGSLPGPNLHISLYCAIVMFNIAIITHLNNRRPKESSLTKALQLYDLTLAFLEEGSHSKCASLVNMRIAILNNKSHIYYELCSFEEAHTGLHTLMAAFSAAKCDRHLTFDRQDIEGFLLNFMLLNANPVAPAA